MKVSLCLNEISHKENEIINELIGRCTITHNFFQTVDLENERFNSQDFRSHAHFSETITADNPHRLLEFFHFLLLCFC